MPLNSLVLYPKYYFYGNLVELLESMDIEKTEKPETADRTHQRHGKTDIYRI